MRSGFWKAGLGVALLFAALSGATGLAITAIDKQGIDNIGRLPWRDTRAKENERINRTLGDANGPRAEIRSFSEVPEGLIRFLERALAKNPDERFQTGEHFAGALREAMGAPAKVDLEL